MNKISGKYLKKIREEHGYSLRALAEKIFISKSTIQRWEKSYLPEDNVLLNEIAKVFNTTVDAMRISSAKLCDESIPEAEDQFLTPEQQAEVKFGIKGLIITAIIIGIFLIVIILLPIIF